VATTQGSKGGFNAKIRRQHTGRANSPQRSLSLCYRDNQNHPSNKASTKLIPIFGSYGWSRGAVKMMTTRLQRSSFEIMETRALSYKRKMILRLLANKDAKVTGVVAAESGLREECEVNNFIRKIEGTVILIKGFGSSDCRHKCGSHHIYFGEESIKGKIAGAFRHLFEYCNVLDSFQNQVRK